MAWTLRLYNETGVTLEKTITESTVASGIHGGFTAVVRSSGDCVSLTFRGRNDLLKIRARQIVRLDYESNPIFWGVFTKVPNLASPGAGFDDSGIADDLEEFVAEGGRTLIADKSSGPKYVGDSADVASIFTSFLTLYGPSQLASDLTQIVTTNSVLTVFYKPSAQLDTVLDELVSTVDGWSWGVDAQGRVFLKELAGLQEFSASELVDFYFKAVNGEDVVTKVNLVVAGSPAGRVPEDEAYYRNDPTLYDANGNGETDARITEEYVPVPIVHSYEHPLHATYGAERTFALPPGVVPFLEAPDAAAISGMTLSNPFSAWSNIANVYDGNESTFAATAGSTWFTLEWTYQSLGADAVANQKVVGFRLVYSAEIGNTAYGNAVMRYNPHISYRQYADSKLVPIGSTYPYSSSQEYFSVIERLYLIRSTYDPADAAMNKGAIYSVVPFSSSFVPENLNAGFTAESSYARISVYATEVVAGTSKIYHYYPLVLNTDLLDEVAKSNISLPSTLSGDVVVLGYRPPRPVVRVVNLYGEPVGNPPSTDMYESVGTIEYTMTPEDGFVTKYAVGNDSASDAAALLKRYVRDGITAANYALTMR